MAIVTVLVILAVTSGIAASLTFLSIDANQTEQTFRQGEQALLFSESCLENGYLQIVRDPGYSGSSFQMSEGKCDVSVTLDNGTYEVHAIGENGQYERGLVAQVTRGTDKLEVVSWNEE